MGDFVTLSCPSCGGKLQITKDIDRFACGYCGHEHMVKRSGGIVSLSPVVEALRRVEVGTDKTAAELAIIRLEKEIRDIQAQRNHAVAASPSPPAFSTGCLSIVYPVGWAGGVALFLLVTLIHFFKDMSGWFLLVCLVPAVAVGVKLHTLQPSRVKQWKMEMERWEAKVKSLDAQLTQKDRELQHCRDMVSQ